MNYYKNFYSRTVQKDFVSRFNCLNSYQIFKLEKMTLNIQNEKSDINKTLLLDILGLEFITSNSPLVTKARKSNVLFGILKNYPTGVKLDLHGFSMFSFLQKLGFFIFPKIKVNSSSKYLLLSGNFSFSIKQIDDFQELTFFYKFFKHISYIDYNLKINGFVFKDKLENSIGLMFLITSLNFPLSFQKV